MSTTASIPTATSWRAPRRRPAAVAGPRPVEDPAWVRPALLGCRRRGALLCLWNLTRNGYSNEYYAAAAKAGSESWKAWFFGSLDPGSFITVDKPPLSLWLMGALGAGCSGSRASASCCPQALCTIAAVGLLYRDRPPGVRATARG